MLNSSLNYSMRGYCILLPRCRCELVLPINMSISEAALGKLTKDEVIALTLGYQAKFDSTLSNTILTKN